MISSGTSRGSSAPLRGVIGATIVILVGIVGAFLLACAFAHPIADDFDFASHARESGLVNAWRQQYVTWNGRYSSNLFALAIPLSSESVAGYRVAVGSVLVATFVALYLFLRSLAWDAFTRIEVLAATLALTALFLCQMPSIGEGIYWYTSAVTYQLAVVFALLHFACVAGSRRRKTHTMVVLGTALLVVVIGFNEVMMTMTLAVYLVLAAVDAATRGRDRSVSTPMLAVAMVSAGIVVVSPGNAARLAEYPLRHQFGHSLVMTALQTVRFIGEWMASGPLLVASGLWLIHADRLTTLVDPRRARVYLSLCIVGLLLVVPISAFPAYWATGILGQHRTMNTAYFEFLVLWFLALGFWSALGGRWTAAVQTAARELRVPLVVLLLASLALTHNSYGVGADLVAGRFAAFDREMLERESTLRACREARSTNCDIEAVRTIPASFFVLDISRDAHDWVNVAYARYFGLADVRLKTDGFTEHVRY